jgi:DNA repair protein RecO (recombination protein O)
LFLFLSQSIEVLDCTHEVPANFHLIFMLKLTRFLGFEPHLNNETGKYFDLINGEFMSAKPLHAHYVTDARAVNLCWLDAIDYFNMKELTLSRMQRGEVLNTLIEYYRLHIPGFHGLNSLAVLQSIFD